ncbi:MAG: primosomal protein N' [Raineya sp.]|jgi:primosomal protein N' (replication factor Y)|nr:primosomal protein N' [Raineya sp.]
MKIFEPNETERVTLFVDVILPIPIPKLFTYRIPFELNEIVQVGSRAIVQFGNKKVLTAVIAKIHQIPPQHYQAKYILELLDTEPLVTQKQLDLFAWMADYYLCTIGEVMNIALPSGLKISSQSMIELNPNSNPEEFELTEKETKLLGILKEKKALAYQEAAVFLELKNIYHIIKSLTEKELIIVYEEVKERYQPKKVKKVRLTRDYLDKTDLEKLFKYLEEKEPKQLDVLLLYLRNVPVFRDWTLNETGLEKSVFRSNPQISNSSVETLIKNGIFDEFEIVVSRFADIQPADSYELNLTEYQQQAVDRVMELFEDKQTVLLHGITGSGKTEIYIDLIQKVLDSGSQVLYLLPEIALTTQIVARLRKIFGDKMGVYHSKFSDNERVEVWKGVINQKFSFVVGVRSAVFLPFDNLGLIIVDEEHEPSYKQNEPAPRYHARDVAVLIAHMQQAKVLLGSATPAVESYYNAQMEKYGFIALRKRFGNAQLPDIELVDMKEEKKQKKMKQNYSSVMFSEMESTLAKHEQVILFQNRRGYSPYLNCSDCGWIPKCNNCNVSLTYHQHSTELRCHYCGFKMAVPQSCFACGSTKMKSVGYGTEKLEDDLKNLLPEAKVRRMDLDTTRQKNAYQNIINDFETGQIDILVGTQMISKGLDFDKVSLVGIFDADRLLYFADFRSHERAFQLITQVSGRAGRRDIKGKVIIQTNTPEHPTLQRVLKNDYEGFYEEEILEREKYSYPPFARLIKLTVRHREKDITKEAAQVLTELLREQLGKPRVLGPESPLIDRIRNQYIKHILVKLEREKINLKAVKEFVAQQCQNVMLMKQFKSVQVVIDVDPM